MVIGTWALIPSAAAANVLAAAGLDFVIADMEHGVASFETVEEIVRAVESENATPLVRVAKNDEALILRALETGAHGVVVPQITTPEDASRAVAAMKYAPLGTRGFSPYTRSAGYLPDRTDALADQENEQVMSILLVEGLEGIRNLDEILAVPGIDVVYLGVYDLSQSAGVPGQVEHPRVQELIGRCVEVIRRSGVTAGCLLEDLRALESCRAGGFGFVAYLADTALLFDAAREAAAARGLHE